MEFLNGTKEEFFNYIEEIRPWEKIAILTHNDLDGLASALFLEKILEAKEKKVNCVTFLKYKKNFLFDEISKFRQIGINKILICDLSADSNLEEFEALRAAFDIFLIDHHPINPLLEDKKNVIKTASSDCSTHCIYTLGEGIIDQEEWNWLVCATMFSETSYKNPVVFSYMREAYPDLTLENLASSTPGINAIKIGNALIYYQNNERIVYDLVKEKNLSELEDVSKIVNDEIDYHVENYLTEAQYYPERKLYIYELKSKYEISSPVITIISKYKPDYSFILFVRKKDGTIKISSRNQSEKEDMNQLMRKGVEGLEEAIGGGHKAASGATIKEEDLDKFIENILN